MDIRELPPWMEALVEEDLEFIRNFIVSSGSLKELAEIYGVSYPTVRLRLDRLIQKVELYQKLQEDPYVLLIKKLALEEKIDLPTAKILIKAYRKKETSY